ncbi:DUF7144 family membrane protein [Streptomyces sp. NPDC003753]|uniref:DUF7144 family membrane protein n=1 Tax=unclassified Streptomyces TaxID=2593676 RepID=UPI0019041F4B|nr:hypothetical protein [Streptomyces sp. Y2F8-2]GHK03479.1 hypothetical protein SY2F82_52760 [Streptomyces sp. Y2F8-2]
MAQHTASTPHARQTAWATGGMAFAGVLMMVGGIVGVLNGIAGIATNNVYVRVGDYVYQFSLATWGWIHLIVGALVAITGWGVLQGLEWARWVGVGLAALYMILYFMFLPYAPIWSIIAIAIGGFVIWSLVTVPRTERVP